MTEARTEIARVGPTPADVGPAAAHAVQDDTAGAKRSGNCSSGRETGRQPTEVAPPEVGPPVAGLAAETPPAAAPSFLGRLGRAVRRLGPAGPAAVATAVLPFLGGLVVIGLLGSMLPWLRTPGWGPVLCVVLFSLFGGLALIPTYGMTVFAGWGFGFAVGYPTSLVGFVGAAVLSYLLGSRVAGDRVVCMIRENPRAQAVYEALVTGSFRRTMLIVILMRLSPAPPFAFTNLLLSCARVPLGPYALGTLIGLAPQTAALVFAASQLEELDFRMKQGWWLLAGGIAAAVLAVFVIGRLARRALAAVTGPAQKEAEGAAPPALAQGK